MDEMSEENESDDTKTGKTVNGENDENESVDKHENETKVTDQEDAAISNATKNLLSSICLVFSLLFDEKYKFDYHVSLEKVMELKKFEHKPRAVSHA